jgi:hypothetical protein
MFWIFFWIVFFFNFIPFLMLNLVLIFHPFSFKNLSFIILFLYQIWSLYFFFEIDIFLILSFNIELIENWVLYFFSVWWSRSHDLGHKYEMLTRIDIGLFLIFFYIDFFFNFIIQHRVYWRFNFLYFFSNFLSMWIASLMTRVTSFHVNLNCLGPFTSFYFILFLCQIWSLLFYFILLWIFFKINFCILNLINIRLLRIELCNFFLCNDSSLMIWVKGMKC